MEVFVFVGLTIVLLLIGVPVYISFIVGSIAFIAVRPDALSSLTVPHLMFASVDKWTLLAIPFFMLAGNLLVRGGTAGYLTNLLDKLIGHRPGGMSAGAVGAAAFFSALSGSGPATTVAIGQVMIDPMVKRGYQKDNAMGLISASGCLGNIIPPSIGMIIVAQLMEQDVGRMFIGGVGAGLLLAAALAIVSIPMAIRTGYGSSKKASWQERGRAFLEAIPALGMPAVILGGIYTGFFTPTEAAAVSCVYAVVAGAVYRKLSWPGIRRAFYDAVRSTASLYILFTGAILFATILTYLKIPQAFTELIVHAGLSPVGFLLGTLGLVAILGCFLDATPILVITIPILWPAAQALGIDGLYYGVVLLIGVIGGQCTPPFGINLFAMSSLTQEPLQKIYRAVIPYAVTLYVAMLALVAWPEIVTWLPSLMSGSAG